PAHAGLKGGEERTSMPGAESLLAEIEAFCRRPGMAESTFGRLAVNDGKLCTRLRSGKAVTLETANKIRTSITQNEPPLAESGELDGSASPAEDKDFAMSAKTSTRRKTSTRIAASARPAEADVPEKKRPFRFYDNRQKYLAFVNTTNEKWKVAERATRELALLKPRPPALRVFDAGMGDATVLAHLMRAMHRRFPIMPFFIVAKEISLEDVRLGLEKLPDRFIEHPATVIVITNLYYAEAPWLRPRDVRNAAALNWREVALE